MSWASMSWMERLRRRLSAPASITVVALTIIPTVMLLATLAYPVGGGGVREFTSSDRTTFGGSSAARGIRPLRASFVRNQLPGLSGTFNPNDSALTGPPSLLLPSRQLASPKVLGGPLALVDATTIRPLVNDHFASAYPIGTIPFNAHSLTKGATSDASEPTECLDDPSTVWFEYTAPKDQALILSTFGSDFPASIAMFTGDDVRALHHEGSCGSRFMTFAAKRATTYFIQVGGAGDLVFHLTPAPGRGHSDLESRSSSRQSHFASDTGTTSADGRYVTFDSADAALQDDNELNNVNALAGGTCFPFPTTNLSEFQRGSVRPCGIGMYQRDTVTGRTMGINGGFDQHPSDDASVVSFLALRGDGTGEVFAWDRSTGVTERIDRKPNGTPSDDSNFDEVVSGDGRYVSFVSIGNDIIPGSHTNGTTIVYDRITHSSRLVRTPGGAEINAPVLPVCLNRDGRYIVVWTAATNLVPNDTNKVDDFFRVDLVTGDAVRVNVSSTGAQADKSSGRIQFISGHCMSNDGRYVMFNSGATNLVPNDTNNSQDVFVHDVVTGTTERVDVSSTGEQANENLTLQNQRVSTPIGNVCASAAVKQFTLDEILAAHGLAIPLPIKGAPVLLPAGLCGGTDDLHFGYAISGNGRYTVFGSSATNLTPDGDTNNASDIFRHDRLTGQTIRVSNAPDGTPGERDSWGHLSITADGRGIVYQSRASNLAPNDFNNDVDVFFWHEPDV